jgi:hypothetical protein
LRRLEAAFEVSAGVAVDRSGFETEAEPATEVELVIVAVVDRSAFESEAEPATEVELVIVAVVVDRSAFESECEAPVDRELLRSGLEVAAAVICTAGETLSAGLAVESSVHMSRDMKQQPPRSPVLPLKPVE